MHDESVKLDHWRIVFQIGSRETSDYRESECSARTFPEARQMVGRAAVALFKAGKIPKNDLITMAELLKNTAAPKTLALGGWAMASYTPMYRIAILPEPGLGYTIDEIERTQ